jgi:5-methylcytosine-specific restriction endonuclease McrA
MDGGDRMTRLTTCLDCGAVIAPGPRCYRCRLVRGRQYDAARPVHHALYRTNEWRRLSAEVRATATRCHWCLKPTTRLIADHVIPVEQRPDLALAPGNLVAACFSCNTRRGRNAKLPDESSPSERPRASTVGDRMAAILGGER